MTTDQPLPVTPQVALSDALYFTERTPGDLAESTDVLNAARTLALVVERVLEMNTSRIGASGYLAQFDGNDFDNYSFYQGVQFALAKVHQTLQGEGDSR